MRRKALIALVFIVAAAVLVESWHAAANAAATGGRPWPWLWPVTLEAFIAVLVLVYWDARSEGRRAPHARGLLLLTTAVASTIQALDAPLTALGILTAAWTPLSLLLTVEFATWLLYGRDARAAGADREPAPAAPPMRAPEVPAPPPPPARAATPAPRRNGNRRRPLTPAQRDTIRELAANGMGERRIVPALAQRGMPAGRNAVRDELAQRSNGDAPQKVVAE